MDQRVDGEKGGGGAAGKGDVTCAEAKIAKGSVAKPALPCPWCR
jgi:hypothetical protein